MQNSYQQIAYKALKDRRRNKYLDAVFHDEQKQAQFNNESFLKIFTLMQKKYQVVARLVGEDNFQIICYQYFKFNPIQSASSSEYGATFPRFLASLEQLQDFKFLPWLAKVDWFWFCKKDSHESLIAPKGTLSSWANVYKDLPQIDVLLLENEFEEIRISSDGNEYKIYTV